MMGILELIKYLPDLITLAAIIKKKIDEDKVDRKVQDDIRSIREAFDSGDSSKLDHIFNGLSDKTDKL